MALSIVPNALDEPVTVVNARRIHPGKEAADEEWLEGIEKVSKTGAAKSP
jgi:hypothetical protein